MTCPSLYPLHAWRCFRISEVFTAFLPETVKLSALMPNDPLELRGSHSLVMIIYGFITLRKPSILHILLRFDPLFTWIILIRAALKARRIAGSTKKAQISLPTTEDTSCCNSATKHHVYWGREIMLSSLFFFFFLLPRDTRSIAVTMPLLSLSVLHSTPTQIECNRFTPVLWGLVRCGSRKSMEKLERTFCR